MGVSKGAASKHPAETHNVSDIIHWFCDGDAKQDFPLGVPILILGLYKIHHNFNMTHNFLQTLAEYRLLLFLSGHRFRD